MFAERLALSPTGRLCAVYTATTRLRQYSGMSLDEVASQLWAEHLTAPFPARPPGEQIVGVDLVMLDADVAGRVQTWMGNDFPAR